MYNNSNYHPQQKSELEQIMLAIGAIANGAIHDLIEQGKISSEYQNMDMNELFDRYYQARKALE